MASIRFLGAAGTVTGSRHLVEHEGKRILLDCGLFQGEKLWRRRNWNPFPVPPSTIDVVVLSHAHIDHTGYLPRLIRDGFEGQVICTPATRDLLAIMLPDSGRLHEEEARYANEQRYSRHDPALPLYTEEDANRCMSQVETLRYGAQREIAPGVVLTFHRAGHILGSASVQLDLYGAGGYRHTVVYSGDLGRYDMPIIHDPAALQRATTLLIESTYGDREHLEADPRGALGAAVRQMVERRGVLIIPSFAIGRCQDLLYHLRQLQLADEIPRRLPIFVDSPMAIDATPLYLMHRDEHDEEMVQMITEGMEPLHPSWVEFTRSVRQSQEINDREGPMIIISASGMATGGRVLHHLKRRLPDPKTSVLFVGYQAQGTRGRKLLDGARYIRIHGNDVPVKATIGRIDGFSAHGDASDVDRWLSSFGMPPVRTFCIHGEPSALEAMRARLERRGWPAYVPGYEEKVELD